MKKILALLLAATLTCALVAACSTDENLDSATASAAPSANTSVSPSADTSPSPTTETSTKTSAPTATTDADEESDPTQIPSGQEVADSVDKVMSWNKDEWIAASEEEKTAVACFVVLDVAPTRTITTGYQSIENHLGTQEYPTMAEIENQISAGASDIPMAPFADITGWDRETWDAASVAQRRYVVEIAVAAAAAAQKTQSEQAMGAISQMWLLETDPETTIKDLITSSRDDLASAATTTLSAQPTEATAESTVE